MHSGSAFQNVGAPNVKLWLKYFFDFALKNKKYGTLRFAACYCRCLGKLRAEG